MISRLSNLPYHEILPAGVIGGVVSYIANRPLAHTMLISYAIQKLFLLQKQKQLVPTDCLFSSLTTATLLYPLLQTSNSYPLEKIALASTLASLATGKLLDLDFIKSHSPYLTCLEWAGQSFLVCKLTSYDSPTIHSLVTTIAAGTIGFLALKSFLAKESHQEEQATPPLVIAIAYPL
jgi:hypothetical protein